MSAAIRCAAIATLAVISLPVAVVHAAPVSRSIDFSCTWPGASGSSPFTATAPFAATEQRGTDKVALTIKDARERLQDANIGAVDGTATLSLRISDGDVTFTRDITVPVPRTSVVPDVPTVLDLGTAIPALADAQDAVTVRLRSASLALNAYDADGFPMPVAGRATTDSVTGESIVQPDDPTAFRANCRDALAEPDSAGAIAATYWAGSGPLTPLTAPAVSLDIGYRTIALDWSAPGGSFPIAGYSILVTYEDGVFSGDGKYYGASGSATGKVITGLGVGRSYRVVVTTGDVTGQTLEIFDSGVVKTPATLPASVTREFTATAKVDLPGIAKAPFTLTGTANLTYGAEGHTINGAFDFQPVLTRLTVKSSALPISSKVALVRSGTATGTYTNGLLNVSQSVRLKVLDARAFGAIPIALGNECQTKELATLTLSSGRLTSDSWALPFVDYGGTVGSALRTSALNGCAAIAAGFDPQGTVAPGSISVGLRTAPVVTTGA
ncbi:MAG: hypothetical protein QM679_11070 [Patulibacter sp.]